MGDIDWKVVLLTMLNFAVVVWIISRFLLKPVLRVLDQRKLQIVQDLAAADAAKKQADDLIEQSRTELKNQLERGHAIVEDAVRVARLKQDEILTETKTKTQQMLVKTREDMRLERTRNLNVHQKDIADLAVGLAGTILERSLDESTHQQLVDQFLTDLEQSEV